MQPYWFIACVLQSSQLSQMFSFSLTPTSLSSQKLQREKVKLKNYPPLTEPEPVAFLKQTRSRAMGLQLAVMSSFQLDQQRKGPLLMLKSSL
ncbi:hypothetical protein MHYP_G00165120 [Metynnis hypsauchen]